MEADAVRRQLHPEAVVSYATGCVIGRGLKSEAIFDVIAATMASDGTEVRCDDIARSAGEVGTCEALFAAIREQFPHATLTGITASEILAMAGYSMAVAREILLRLRDAGLALLAGDDAGMLSVSGASPHVPSPRSSSATDWLEVHRMAHALGLASTAAMTIGAGESAEARVEHLESLQRLQAETGGFRAFALWSFAPQAGGPIADAPTSVEYLKSLAVSRMYLDEIPHMVSSPVSQGTKGLQMGLRFGANDAGMVPAIIRKAKFFPRTVRGGADVAEEEIRRLIRDAGLRPAQRDGLFTQLFFG